MAHFFAIFIFVLTPAFCLDLKQTQALFNKKSYKEVIQQLSPQIEQLDPARLKILGQSYQATEDHDQAIRVFESYLSTKPKDFEVKTLLGGEYLTNKKDKEALATYKDAIELNPKYEPPYLGAAKIYEKRKNKYELRLIYQDLVEQVGEKPEYMKQLCDLTTMDGLLESALEYCKKAKQLKPSEPQNYLNLAIIYKTTGEKELSLKEFSQAADSFPNSIDAQLALADYFHEDKNYPKALLHYQRAAAVDTKNLRALQGEGMNRIPTGAIPTIL